MFDAKRLLDQFIGAQGANQTADHGPRGGAGPGGFGGQGAADLLGQAGNMLNGFGGGALAGGLAGLLLGSKSGRKIAGSALTYGGMAVAGALAYRAYRNWQEGKSTQQTAAGSGVPLLPPPMNTPFNPAGEADQQSLGRKLLRAMIAAAKADGHIDAKEQSNIFTQMDRLGVGADDKAFVMDELRAPLDIDAVARSARSPEEAAEIYAVSLLTIDLDHQQERDYLARLAAGLKLDPALVSHLHASVEGATEPNAGQTAPAYAAVSSPVQPGRP